jgi:HAD superfamily hydrolase (TIGR01490 family)
MADLEQKDLVVFDFCETLVNFQTADRFIDFLLEGKSSIWSEFWMLVSKIITITKFNAFISKVQPKSNFFKRIYLLRIRGISEIYINLMAEQYLNEVINSNLNKMIMDKLKHHQNKGDILIISSGGYEPYLTAFKKMYGLDYLNCSNFEYRNGKATGFLNGRDCMHGVKVELLNKTIQKEKLNYNKIITYSDSYTDLPLFQFSDESFVISYGESKDWVMKNKFNEIILLNELT